MATVFGGYVFDAYGPGAPFMMMSGVNLIIVIWALTVMLRGRSAPGS
jgi:hypothetical protein